LAPAHDSNFFPINKHISYFQIHALCHICPLLDSENSKTCAIVVSRLDSVNSILTSISSRKIHNFQCVQNSLARVVARPTTNTTGILNSLHWLPIQQRINFKSATPVHRSLHNAGPQYLSSLSSHSIASASLCFPPSPLPTSYQHCFCLSWFSTCWPFSLEFPSSSSQIYRLLHCLQSQFKTPLSMVQASLAPNNSIHTHLILHNHVDFCVLKLCYVMLCKYLRNVRNDRL